MIYCTLGIDPGTNYTGWAVLENETGEIVRSGCVSVGSKVKGYKLRMVNIANTIEGILYGLYDQGYKVTYAGIESQFISFNPSSTIVLSRATGALILVVYRAVGIEAEDVAPEAALSVFGFSSHDFKGKRSARRNTKAKAMIERAEELYNIKVKRDDEAFAIAIAEVVRRKNMNAAALQGTK